MAAIGYLESLLNTLEAELRKTLTAFVREAFKTLSFGTPSDEEAVASTNFAGHLVPWTTDSVADQEVAIPHELGRIPRLVITGLVDPSVVGCSAPVVTVTQAADATNLYLSSDVTNTHCLVYVE